MPGEFAPHAGCILIWPEREGSFGRGCAAARKAFAEIIRAISAGEPVHLAVSPAGRPSALSHLSAEIAAGRVLLHEAETDDAWARDVAPTFVGDGRTVRGVDWTFNAWGGAYDSIYESWERDDAFAREMCARLGYDCYDARPFVCEGGSVHSDGEGTLLVTEECLLSPGRNPNLARADIERKLKDMLGADKVLWLPYGIVDDETDGHVDNVCAFTAPGEVVLAWTEDESDPQYARSRADFEALSNARDARGRALTVRKLPIPDAPVRITAAEADRFVYSPGEQRRQPGERLAASYVNFYLANGAVVVPQFRDARDADALRILAPLFPGRQIVPVFSRAILTGGGNIHCITQQIPLAAASPSSDRP